MISMNVLGRVLLSLSVSAITMASACVSVAPPVRMGHYGAPGRVEGGMVEVGGEATHGVDMGGGPLLGYGVTDAIAVEGGAEIGHRTRAIGWAGLRYTPLRGYDRDFALLLDVEGGAGAGVGGRRCVEGVCESVEQNFRRPAGGGYLGLGVGGKFKWFSPWVRLRTQASAAEGVPITSFTTALAGVQFSIVKLAHIFVGTGGYLIANEQFTNWGWFAVNGGVSFTIATPRTLRFREQRR
jgi:hypothetical protein